MTLQEQLELLRGDKANWEALLRSSGWLTLMDFQIQQVALRRDTVELEDTTSNDLPRHFRLLGESAGMRMLASYPTQQLEELDQEIKEILVKLEIQNENAK